MPQPARSSSRPYYCRVRILFRRDLDELAVGHVRLWRGNLTVLSKRSLEATDFVADRLEYFCATIAADIVVCCFGGLRLNAARGGR